MINESNLKSFIAGRIKTLREKAGYTTNGLAYRSGISQSYIRDIEMGFKENISVMKLYQICLSLNVTLPEFFDEEFMPPIPDELMMKVNQLDPDQKESLKAFLDTVIRK